MSKGKTIHPVEEMLFFQIMYSDKIVLECGKDTDVMGITHTPNINEFLNCIHG